MADVTMSDRDVQDLGAFRYLGSTPGELAKKVADLERDNQKFRDKNKELEATAAKVPAEGAIVLTGDEATAYAAWKALEMKPEDVAKLKSDNATLAADKAERDRKDAFAGAVEALKWPKDVVATLLDMKSLDGATVEVKTEKVQGKDGKQEDAPVPYVTLAGEGQKPQKLSEFAASAPQLKGIRTEGGETAATTAGIPMHEMRGGGGGGPKPSGVSVDALIHQNQQATRSGNPLKPAKAAA